MKWNVDNFFHSLQYMWQGMLCIFVVMAVIILSVVIMNMCSAKAEKKKKEENQN